MTEILSDLSEAAVVSALRQNFYNFCWDLRAHWASGTFIETEKQRRWCTPMPMAFIFNAVLSLQPPARDESEQIAETIQFFKAKGKREFNWWLEADLENSNWDRQLRAYGFAFSDNPPGMAAALSDIPERVPLLEGCQIIRVEDAAGMKTWIQTFVPGYGLPPSWESVCLEMMLATMNSTWESYIALVNDQPVATSSVFYNSGVAGIMNVATLEGWRGQGLGAAVTLHPLREARAKGYRVGTLQSSKMGYEVYRRLGFKEVCRMNNYYWEEKG